MALSAGDSLGPYELLASIGEGGMGEVWKARDTRLKRIVAVKVSKREFNERFQREAHAIAALNHPFICQVYDVGENYIVMEHIEGWPPRGPMPIDIALRYGAQIADALSAAHAKGIVHRDLKPANILLTKSGVKLLDFGLAAPIQIAPEESEATHTLRLTAEHSIVGTLQYMSPEQLEGKRVDARTDLFAFGLVMYEMLTGKPAFAADSRASLIAGILKEDPPLPSSVDGARPGIPAAVDDMIATCLAKDPNERWQTARDLRRELERISAEWQRNHITAAPRKHHERIWMAGSIALTMALVAMAVAYVRKQPLAEPPVLASVLPPGDAAAFVLHPNFGGMAFSADGRSLAFGADAGGGPQLYVRALDSLESKKIPGTEGGGKPFWSPTGRAIAFFSQRQLERVDLAGGDPVKLCDCPGFRGGTWNRDDLILFSSSASDGDGRIYRISAAGGSPAPVTTLDKATGENSNYWPEFLPDGRHFLYLSRSSVRDKNVIYAGSLEDAPAQKNRVRIVASSYAARYMPLPQSRSGYLFYVDGTTLFAHRFDPAALKLEGERTPVTANVTLLQTNGYSEFAVAPGGIIVYGSGYSYLTKFVWRDRAGKSRDTPAAPGAFAGFDVSPDGRSVVAAVFEPLTGGSRIDLIDLEHGGEKMVVGSKDGHFESPIWSKDGHEIAYTSSGAIFRMASSGGGKPERLADSGGYLTGWSRDGRWLTYQTRNAGIFKSWALPLAGERKGQLLVESSSNISLATVAPDSRWFAYVSDESGREEVYIQSFPPGRGKWQVSYDGGSVPTWRDDGKELFYIAEKQGTSGGAADLMAVSIADTGDSIRAGRPQPLFTWQPGRFGLGVAETGERFLLSEQVRTGTKPLSLILHWQPRPER